MLLRNCCRFWQQCCRFQQQCRTKFRPFDKVETNWICIICFEAYSTLSKGRNFTTTKSNDASTKSNVALTMLPVASTLLLVWTGLYVYRLRNSRLDKMRIFTPNFSYRTCTSRFLRRRFASIFGRKKIQLGLRDYTNHWAMLQFDDTIGYFDNRHETKKANTETKVW